MSALGLHIGDTLTAVLLNDDGSEQVRVLSYEQMATDLADWLQLVGSRIGAAFAADIRSRSLTFPFAQSAKIRQVLPLQLEELVPGVNENFEQQTQIGRTSEGGLAIVQLLPSTQAAAARAKLSLLTANARFLEPEALLMAEAQNLTPDVAFLWLSEKNTTVVNVNSLGQLVAVSIPIGAMRLDNAAGVANLQARLWAILKSPPSRVRLDGETQQLLVLADIVKRLAPQASIELPSSNNNDAPLPVRVASTAARLSNTRHRAAWNFAPRQPLLSPELIKSGLLKSLGVPLAAVCLLLIVATVSGTRAIHAQADAYTEEISAIFKRNFPRSRDGGDPLRMMRNIVERASKKKPDTQAGKVIEGIAAFHDSITDATGIHLAELRTADGNWSARGEAPDFGGVERIKSAIERAGKFSDVRVQRAEQTPDKAAIRFSLTWEETP